MTGYFDPSISDYRFGAFSLSDSRKAYFSFHFDDLVRVNDVRRTWNIDRVAEPRHHDRGFDSAGGEPLRGLIRDAVVDASAVCVLIGTETWASSRVRFEIARAVADKRGLLGVHLNNIDHHLTRLPHPLGDNPFKYLGVGKIKTEASQMAQYFLFEKNSGRMGQISRLYRPRFPSWLFVGANVWEGHTVGCGPFALRFHPRRRKQKSQRLD